MIKGVIFDKDGTLMDFKAFWFTVSRKAVELMLDNQTIDITLADKVMEGFGVDEGITSLFYHGSYQDFTDRFNETLHNEGYKNVNFTREDTSKAFGECTHFGKIIPACENLLEVFEVLKQKGIKTAVVTTDEPTMTKHCLETLKVSEYIDEVYADDGINPTKPDPYYMNCFLKKYNLDSSEIIMVGDTLTDMTFAKNGGAMAVGVAKETCDKEILKGKADIVLDDVSQILGILEDME